MSKVQQGDVARELKIKISSSMVLKFDVLTTELQCVTCDKVWNGHVCLSLKSQLCYIWD